MRDGDGKKLVLLVGVAGLLLAALAVDEHMTSSSTLPTASGSLPDVPGLREREAAEPGFISTLLGIIQEAGMSQDAGDELTALISEESGFNPQARNAGSGTVGFLQWMPAFQGGRWVGHYTGEIITGDSDSDVQAMSGIEQLGVVRATLVKVPGYKTDPPMAGWGSHLGAPDDAVLASQGQQAYTQNAGYDKDGKGYITVGDVRARVYKALSDANGNPVARITV